MSTDFQKDLYKKSGSLLTVWDICIGVGLITLGSGAYIHFKDKKQQKSIKNPPKASLGMGSPNIQHDEGMESHAIKRKRKIKQTNTKPKPVKKQEVSEENVDTLSKLGL
tara:strand:- start:1048 stop:1374 length:327 start_codon:yes stop_codon:yes gene_type:complete